MRTVILSLLSVTCLMIVSRGIAEVPKTFPPRDMSHSLRQLRQAVDRLQNLPDDVGDVFVWAYFLMQAAEECAERHEYTNARFLYGQALSGLREVQTRRADWKPAVVRYRIERAEKKVQELPTPRENAPEPPLTLPGVKERLPDEPVPDGIEEFEFNRRKYILVPPEMAPTRP
ncbi:MAG: hypothetical protein QOE70_1632 [Chthoniobacter sp.]|jgi:hypothetical protein|nr:hypothetical protein [Chthoniobacter sp.]